MTITHDHLATLESRFGQGVNRMFDTPEAEQLKPAPHLWPAFLYPHESRRGHFVPPNGLTDETVVFASVNHGRWITFCPFCPSAQEASRDDRLFYCARCQNETVGNAVVRVVWPDDADEVERLLLCRPFRENRYWYPHEPLSQLAAENASLGVAG